MLKNEDLQFEKKDRIREEIKHSESTRMVMLGNCGMKNFPNQIFDETSADKILRLDFSHNYIDALPERIGEFKNVKEVWLFNNPMVDELPVEMRQFTKMEILDIRKTNVSQLKLEFCSWKNLKEMVI